MAKSAYAVFRDESDLIFRKEGPLCCRPSILSFERLMLMFIGFTDIELDAAIREIDAATAKPGWTDQGRRQTQYRLLMGLLEHVQENEEDLLKLFHAGNNQLSGKSKTEDWKRLCDDIWAGGLLAAIHDLDPV